MGRRPGREAADAGEACVFRRSRNGLRPTPAPCREQNRHKNILTV